jgi:DNA-binding CsgD family transcriptional regulator
LIEEAIGIARDIDWLPGEAFALISAAVVIGARRPAAAFASVRYGLRIAEQIGHRQWQLYGNVVLAELAISLLDFAAARLHLDVAVGIAREIGSAFWLRGGLADLASVMVATGDFGGAEVAIAEALGDEPAVLTLDRSMVWFAWAKLNLARGDATGALTIVDRLIAAAMPGAGGDLSRLPHLARLRGEALTGLRRTDDANAALDAAHAGASERGDRSLLWQVHVARAALLRGRGPRERVQEEIAAAHAVVRSLADDLDDDAQRAAFLARANSILPPPRSLSPRQAAKAAYGGLTERERDVAALIAAGRSNREIGDALFMSERTAATHVGNILGKLGLRTRAQIAAWAQERGLTADRLG